VVFNAAISNRDDHLRNHGFILMPNGWRLSPAFDINPNIDKAEHALNLDIGDNRANLESVIATAQYYELTQDQAVQIVSEILSVTRTWEAVAKKSSYLKRRYRVDASRFSVLVQAARIQYIRPD